MLLFRKITYPADALGKPICPEGRPKHNGVEEGNKNGAARGKHRPELDASKGRRINAVRFCSTRVMDIGNPLNSVLNRGCLTGIY
jgi:hypothetical protein